MLCSYPLWDQQTDPLADSLEMSGQSHGLGFSHSETIGFASFLLSENLAVCESKRPWSSVALDDCHQSLALVCFPTEQKPFPAAEFCSGQLCALICLCWAAWDQLSSLQTVWCCGKLCSSSFGLCFLFLLSCPLTQGIGSNSCELLCVVRHGLSALQVAAGRTSQPSPISGANVHSISSLKSCLESASYQFLLCLKELKMTYISYFQKRLFALRI